ncbi:magnetosome biogenesis transporter MamN [Magnetospira sp. QH-2]|uniref:magnetosome biogenesis transporter MamN n=1 Tax=Magnetospira sp. (strain QH-2) TaxID=1288970 RepID=UPI0003E8190D|nr:magnetosome biogenesis transporter MamN [Magnetospira sp. QH-2]CCQ72995.1 Magnetosome protein MamN [Magnetospira sp. QH-2]
MDTLVALAIFLGVFTVIFKGMIDRHSAVLYGAIAMILVGALSGFYSFSDAIDAIYFETLALIFGMSAISSLLARSGVFAHLADRAARSSGGNAFWLLLVFSLLTYALSLTINNLATMVVLLPVTLATCRRMKINPIPVLIAEIVSSNLGGASTMVGDFPNMIIASAAQLSFLDFIGGMMVPCLVLLTAALLFFQSRRHELRVVPSGPVEDDDQDDWELPRIDQFRLRLGLMTLGLAILGFLMADALQIRPGWIALMAGVIAAAGARFGNDEIAEACGVSDIQFFAGLFILVGGLVAAGVPDGFSSAIYAIAGDSEAGRLLVMMWTAAGSTIFLNAGPSTALFVSLAPGLVADVQDPTVWWALSLGVQAGSSAALTGATAGAVAATQLSAYLRDHPDMLAHMPEGRTLDFKEFLRWGLPLMGIFLLLSSLYVLLII